MLGDASRSAAARLRRSPVDPAQVSVSGIAAGAFIAHQLHIARSVDIMSAAVIAGERHQVSGAPPKDVDAGGAFGARPRGAKIPA
jgi:poly(3-hydroxybutyrate) depolymerase